LGVTEVSQFISNNNNTTTTNNNNTYDRVVSITTGSMREAAGLNPSDIKSDG